MLESNGVRYKTFRVIVARCVDPLAIFPHRWLSKEAIVAQDESTDREMRGWTCRMLQETNGNPILRIRVVLPLNHHTVVRPTALLDKSINANGVLPP